MRHRPLRASRRVLLLTSLLASLPLAVGCGAGGTDVGAAGPDPLPPPEVGASWSLVAGSSAPDALHGLAVDGTGLVAGGSTQGFGAGERDVLLLGLEEDGKLAWQRAIGGSLTEQAHAVAPRGRGTLVVAETNSYGVGHVDAWLLDVGVDGALERQRAFGAAGYQFLLAASPTGDGGHVLAGATETAGRGDDGWVVRLDDTGEVLWQRAVGGPGNDWLRGIAVTPDGGAVAAGWTRSFGADEGDVWVVKLDSEGDLAWQQRIPADGLEEAYAVLVLPTGDVFVAAAVWPAAPEGGTYGEHDRADLHLYAFEADGTFRWARSMGGSGFDEPRALATLDGRVLVSGYTSSAAGPDSDVWLLAFDTDGTLAWQRTYGGSRNEMPKAMATVGDAVLLAGRTHSFGQEGADGLVLALDGEGRSSSPAYERTATLSVTVDTPVPLPTTGSATTTEAVFTTTNAAMRTVATTTTDALVDRGPVPARAPFVLDFESDAEIAASLATLDPAGASPEYEAGIDGGAARFVELEEGHLQVVLDPAAIDFSDEHDDGGRLDLWIKFNGDPHTYAGAKHLMRGEPLGGSTGFSIEIYGSTPYIVLETQARNGVNPRSRYRFFTYTESWPLWTDWVPGTWHKLSWIWKRNPGEGNAEMHVTIDDSQAGAAPHKVNDYFGRLPDPGSLTRVLLGNMGGNRDLDHSLDALTVSDGS